MDLDALYALDAADQRVFLLGRLADETTSVDAALRWLHAALNGERSVTAFRDAPAGFQRCAEACSAKVNTSSRLTQEQRAHVSRTISDARAAYKRRNRYTHDLLVEDLLSVNGWELMRLDRFGPDFTSTSAAEMVALVVELVALKYRLRGAALYLLQGRWEAWAFGAVEGSWDGSAGVSGP
ncbi:hypothetical protein ITJ50_03405 [Curtobacterium sp. VKM Ac-2889]|uniref:hypothetical protein n=1 Tax=unclassified Curtobacterium TaxID=257496 RepID=UPI00188A01EA|nr:MULTISPECIES: hypothetical protein [unclassified Curtobacterium]MBF4598163.1 hypothetical protein [Curtobacterium sp. VKM Ac-1796]MBF4610258.1 hypothetical protein [Curtobacterium sp. VKM Ac-2889]